MDQRCSYCVFYITYIVGSYQDALWIGQWGGFARKCGVPALRTAHLARFITGSIVPHGMLAFDSIYELLTFFPSSCSGFR